MSLARGRYGVEYDARSGDDDSSGLGWAVVLAVLAATVTLAVTAVRRARSLPDEADPPSAGAVAETRPEERPGAAPPSSSEPVAVRPDVLAGVAPKIRNLLMKFAEAERSGDVATEVNVLEQVRAVPGGVPPDLGAELTRRLGALNLVWLFDLANAQWVETVTVKPGDSAIRLAREHGSTFASLRRLNPELDTGRLVAGRRLKVMNHPVFTLEAVAGARQADLRLNGKFFKRYELREPASGRPGLHELAGTVREFLAANGLRFTAEDRAELETLLARRTTVRIRPEIVR